MTEVHSAFVSQVEPIDYSDLAGRFDALVGQQVTAGRARLHIGERSGTGFAGTAYYGGTLRTGSLLVPSVKVEIVVSPWSSARSEIGIRPLTSLGSLDSLRSNRFYSAARGVLGVVFEQLHSGQPVEDSAALVLAA